jgi:hypothetical protein
MKTITINVSEPTYREFQAYARRKDRKASELIREAMELYKEQTIQDSGAHSLRDLKPRSLGKVLQSKVADEDLLGEMVNL